MVLLFEQSAAAHLGAACAKRIISYMQVSAWTLGELRFSRGPSAHTHTYEDEVMQPSTLQQPMRNPLRSAQRLSWGHAHGLQVRLRNAARVGAPSVKRSGAEPAACASLLPSMLPE